jgi:hypothetical protein
MVRDLLLQQLLPIPVLQKGKLPCFRLASRRDRFFTTGKFLQQIAHYFPYYFQKYSPMAEKAVKETNLFYMLFKVFG